MILVGDCREVLPTLPAGFADCCIADPPYGDTSLDWDKPCKGWVPHVARVLKPNGALWCFGSLRFIGPMLQEFSRYGFRYSQDIVWEKQNGSGRAADRFRRVHEHAVLVYRGRWRDVYHQPQFTMDAKKRHVAKTGGPAHQGKFNPTSYTSVEGGPRLMRSVLKVRNEHGRAIHPTQKPVDLLKPLVRYSCPPGGTVLDCFAGSGSTGAAAAAEGRESLLIELDPGRAEDMRARLANEVQLLQAA